MIMGTGKTRVAIEVARKIEARSILIHCPLRVVAVWPEQFERFAPAKYQCMALDDRVKSVGDKTLMAKDLARWGHEHSQRVAIAVNYESAWREPFASWALSRPWDLVIADEAHRAKSPVSRTSRYLAQLGLRAHRRLALTGTPMAHQPTDIWAQFRFLDPHFLDPTFSQFRDRYAVLGGYFNKEIVGWKNLDQLEAQFRTLAFRVDDSVLDLPPELDQTLTCNLGEKGEKIYRQMEAEMIAWIETEEGLGREVTAANAMVKLLRLQQITGGTVRDPEGHDIHVDLAKEDLLSDLLEDLREPVVVFARFKSDLAAIHRAAGKAGHASGELSGSRDDSDDWRQGRRKLTVLATQIQAGGIGVDLTRARIAVYYSLGFSLTEYLQSRARVRRPPQQRPCLFYHLQARGSVDEYILRAVEARGDLINSVLGELKKKGKEHVPALR